MENKNIYAQVYQTAFNVEKSVIKSDLKYNDIPEWDSIGHMALIAELEDSFEITLEMDDVIDFGSYDKGKEILKKYNVEI